MFDIDKYLEDMKIKNFEPSDALVEDTKKRCAGLRKPNKGKHYSKAKKSRFTKAAIIAIPAAAMLIIGVFLGAFLFGEKTDPSVVAFYTVDINPSICINVDENEIVKSVKSQNEDAKELIKELKLGGLGSSQAIEMIIEAARKAGFIDESNSYVLVGRFGDGNDEALFDLQAKLEADLDEMIQLLIVSGSYEDKLAADKLNVSAGLLKLSRMAEGVEIKDDSKVKDIVEEVSQYNQYKYIAPTIKAVSATSGITLSWNELDFVNMGYTGKVIYQIMAAKSETDLKNMSAVKIGALDFLSTDEQPTSYFIESDAEIFETGDYCCFALYAVYSGDIYVKSNIVKAAIPGTSPTPSPTPSPSATPLPSATPEPAGKLVSGYVSGEYVYLSWQKNEKEGFSGYKIVASTTNENPAYPEDGYLKYITDVNTTSKSLYEGYAGLKANTYYYFSVTYLYNDGSRIIGNAVRLKVPEKEDEPEPTTTPTGDYDQSTISGSIDGSTISLNWSAIDDSRFAGYKVVASYTVPNPVYPNQKYLYYITSSGDTSRSFDVAYLVSKLGTYESGAVCHFSITVLYDGGTTKIAGNAITLSLPEPEEPEPYPTSTISGSIDGDNITLNWDQIDDSRFTGYKVVASYTVSNPKYPDQTYLYYITTNTYTGRTFSIDYLISKLGAYESGAVCHFSITALYDGGSTKIAGNAITLSLPEP